MKGVAQRQEATIERHGLFNAGKTVVDSASLPATLAVALRGPLPGLKAQKRMAVHPRPGGFVPPTGHIPKEGGVLVLLYPHNGRWYLPLILRAKDESVHSGQVSLPGGAHEGTETLIETALREAQEELGISPQEITIIGALTPLYIPASGYRITPVVGHAAQRPAFRPRATEVQQVLEAPLHLFITGETVGEEYWQRNSLLIRVPFYRVGEHKVWGATAMVLSELAVILRQAGYDGESI